jgi:hypothetical protein
LPGTGGILISFGDGRGGVESTRQVALGPTQALLASDVNNDSRIDLITAGASPNSNTSTISVFINTGVSPQFNNPPQQQYNVNFTVKALAIGDFNNDGRKDLVASALNGNSIALLLGADNGALIRPSVLLLRQTPRL